MNRVKLGLLTTAIVALAAIGIAVAHPGHPPITPPTLSLPAHGRPFPFQLFRGTRIIVPVVVNGHPTQAMLDTAASMTTLDRAYARSIGIAEGFKIEGKGTGGIVEAELVSGVNLSLIHI